MIGWLQFYRPLEFHFGLQNVALRSERHAQDDSSVRVIGSKSEQMLKQGYRLCAFLYLR